jgi:predicted nucleic acid-binding protein
MSLILVDSSIWINYFRGNRNIDYDFMNEIIDNNQICTNNLILSELIPSLLHNKQNEIIDILKSIKNIALNINWDEIITFQHTNIKNGINNVGIPDLIIMQNVIDNALVLYSNDKHFTIMSKHFKYRVM